MKNGNGTQKNTTTPIWKLTQLELYPERPAQYTQRILDQQSSNLMEQAYLDIKRKIQNCEYMPGTELNEKMLYADFPYGRTPIREAILYLKRDGLIEVFPRKGMRITSIAAKELSDVFALRRILENSAFSDNAALSQKDVLINFGKELDAMQEEERRLFELDQNLHTVLVQALRNELLNETYAALLDKSYRAYCYFMQNKGFLGKRIYTQDIALIQGMLHEDLAAVRLAIEEYNRSILIELLEGLPQA